jgi:hypothetical protein
MYDVPVLLFDMLINACAWYHCYGVSIVALLSDEGTYASASVYVSASIHTSAYVYASLLRLFV